MVFAHTILPSADDTTTPPQLQHHHQASMQQQLCSTNAEQPGVHGDDNTQCMHDEVQVQAGHFSPGRS